MTTYTYQIINLYTENIQGNENYVVGANYNVIGVDDVYIASILNFTQFSTADVGVFIPYADLTEEIVIDWIKETLGIEGVLSIEASIQGQIDSQINPPVSPVNTPLPW